MLTVSKFLKFKCSNDEKSNCLHVLGGWMCGKQIWFQEAVMRIPVGGDFHSDIALGCSRDWTLLLALSFCLLTNGRRLQYLLGTGGSVKLVSVHMPFGNQGIGETNK